MESGAGSQGHGHSRGLRNLASGNRHSLHLQRALLFVIIATMHVQWAASKRDMTIISEPLTTRPWNKTLFKIELKCLDFHWENQSTYFYYWPEDDPDAHFEYCCAPEEETLPQYRYGQYGPILQARKYFDLGLIDQCLPFWKCNDLFQTFFQTDLYIVYCELTDLRNLFKWRFVVRTVLKYGLLESAIPLIVSSEILVLFLVALYWYIWRRPVDGSRAIVKDASGAWFHHVRKTLLIDWTHLCLLTVVGNGLVEAVGRQNPYYTQSKAFFNYARLYVVLSILVWYSSVLQQVAYAIAEIDLYYEAPAQGENGNNQASTERNRDPGATLPPLSIPRLPPAIEALERTLGLNDDWKWQPIAAQAGILFCLWGFLTYSSDEATTGAVFGIIVSAACPWSGVYASKVIVRAFPWLLRRVCRNLFKRRQNERRNYRGLWRSVLPLVRWSGRDSRARYSIARPEDSAAFQELVETDYAV